jgi:hypothetical protein
MQEPLLCAPSSAQNDFGAIHRAVCAVHTPLVDTWLWPFEQWKLPDFLTKVLPRCVLTFLLPERVWSQVGLPWFSAVFCPQSRRVSLTPRPHHRLGGSSSCQGLWSGKTVLLSHGPRQWPWALVHTPAALRHHICWSSSSHLLLLSAGLFKTQLGGCT